MKKLSLFLVIVLFVLLVSCLVVLVVAEPSWISSWVKWIQSYGDEGDEVCYSGIRTSDGGYALGGSTNSFGAGNSDFWLIKTDASGNVEWNKTFGGNSYDVCHSIIGTSDGGYALAGSTMSFDVGIRDFWLVKTDSLGNVEWNQSYGSEAAEIAYSLVQTADEGFALAGYRSYVDADFIFWIVKTDDQGNREWNRTFSGTGYSNIAYSIIETSDLGLAVAGTAENFGEASDYVRLIKTDGSGNIDWEFQSEGADGDRCRDVVETTDGGFVLACKIGSMASEEHELALIKIDSEGNQIWNQTYGEGFANSVIATSDGGFALTGFTRMGYGNEDFLLVKTDNQGNELWRRFYGTPEHERAYSVIETFDGFTLVGYREVWIPRDNDFWLVKTNVQGIPENNLTLFGFLFLGIILLVVKLAYKKREKSFFRRTMTATNPCMSLYTLF